MNAAAQPVSRAAVFAAFMRMGFLRMLAYRVRYVVGVANYILYVAVAWFLWDAVYASQPPPDPGAGPLRISGYTLGEMITYLAIGRVVRAAYFNNVDQTIANRFVQGDIAIDMSRPCGLYLMHFGDAVGEMIFRFLAMALPITVLCMLMFPLAPPPGALHAACFLASCLLAFHLFFCINFLTGQLALYFENLRGFLWAKYNLIELLSGVLFPLALFPNAVVQVFDVLPFRHIANTPLRIYLGKVDGGDLGGLLAVQAAWGLVLYLVCQWTWRRARRSLSIQGG